MKIACPKCGARAGSTGSTHKAYCAACGWNARVAAEALRSDIRSFAGASVIGLVLVLFALLRRPFGWRGALAVGAAFVLFPVSFGLIARFRLRRVLAAGQSSGELASVHENAAQTSTVRHELNGTASRTVRLTWGGWLYCLGMLALMVILLALFRTILAAEQSFASANIGTLIVVYAGFLVWLFLCCRFFWSRWTEHGLILRGDSARGVVVGQHAPSRSLPRIDYVFQARTGRDFRKRATDFSLKLYEEMAVTVFYDAQDPNKSVALEASLFRIKTESSTVSTLN